MKKETFIISALVVDDNKNICSILSSFLYRLGHKAKTVDNGSDAIMMAASEDFDLVLCDIDMPIVSGYDVAKALNGLKKIPRIGIITGCNLEFRQEAGEELKVDFILMKPFTCQVLAKHIDVAFSQNYYFLS